MSICNFKRGLNKPHFCFRGSERPASANALFSDPLMPMLGRLYLYFDVSCYGVKMYLHRIKVPGQCFDKKPVLKSS